MDSPETETFPAYIVPNPFSGDPDFSPGAVWWEARQDYLKGDSAPTVCERYDLVLSTFRTRARKEGWRRCDQEERQADLSEPRDLEPAPPTPQLVDLAWRAMADALKCGRAGEAKSFMRLHTDLRREVEREEAHARHAARMAAEEAETPAPELHHLHCESDGATDAQTPVPWSPSGSTRGPSNPPGVVEGTTLGSSPRETEFKENSGDAATPDPALHGLHCEPHSATATDDLVAMDDDLAAEIERLQARARAGKASKPEILLLQAKRNLLRESRKARDFFAKHGPAGV